MWQARWGTVLEEGESTPPAHHSFQIFGSHSLSLLLHQYLTDMAYEFLVRLRSSILSIRALLRPANSPDAPILLYFICLYVNNAYQCILCSSRSFVGVFGTALFLPQLPQLSFKRLI